MAQAIFEPVRDFYVPIQAEADHHLKNIIGNKHFQKLSAAFGGKRIGIPFPPRLPPKKVAVIDAVLDTPATSKEIARRCNVSQRYVRSIRAELRECGLLKACVGGASEYGFIGQTRPKALPGDAG